MSEPGRFASTVDLYVAHRPRYPQAFLDGVARRIGLDGRGRLLDLGCGPGFLAIGFAPEVEEAIGIDPEPSMLEAARRLVAESGARVRLCLGSSATLGDELMPLRAVVMGRSFHWMDREATIDRLDELVAPGGAVVLLGDRPAPLPENDWIKVERSIIRRWLDRDEQRRLGERWRGHARILRRSAFPCLEQMLFRQRSAITLEGVVGRALSRSITSPARLGQDRPAFETALRDALAPYLRDGVLEQILDFTALIARRAA